MIEQKQTTIAVPSTIVAVCMRSIEANLKAGQNVRIITPYRYPWWRRPRPETGGTQCG